MPVISQLLTSILCETWVTIAQFDDPFVPPASGIIVGGRVRQQRQASGSVCGLRRSNSGSMVPLFLIHEEHKGFFGDPSCPSWRSIISAAWTARTDAGIAGCSGRGCRRRYAARHLRWGAVLSATGLWRHQHAGRASRHWYAENRERLLAAGRVSAIRFLDPSTVRYRAPLLETAIPGRLRLADRHLYGAGDCTRQCPAYLCSGQFALIAQDIK